MTTVYVDTNIIIDENFFRSATAEAFIKACRFLNVAIVIPEVVVDETKGNYRRRLKNLVSAFGKAQRELGKLASIDETDISVDDHTRKYVDWLDEFISPDHIEVPDYPDVSLKELVEQSYAETKPFKETGEGHKDYLIWRTIRRHIETAGTQPPYFFATKNVKDFCIDDGNGEKVLHPQLAEQIPNQQNRPSIYPSLKRLYDEQLAPRLEGVELKDLKNLNKEDIEQRARKVLEEGLPLYSATGFEGVPFGEDVTIVSVQDETIETIELKKVDDEIIIGVSGRVDIEVEGFVERSAYYIHADDENVPDIHIIDPDWNDWVMQASTTIETPFEVTLIYSPQNKTFSAGSIVLAKERENDWYK